ncbi:hypothetical protein ACJX0J_021046, partial [Zea mays]
LPNNITAAVVNNWIKINIFINLHHTRLQMKQETSLDFYHHRAHHTQISLSSPREKIFRIIDLIENFISLTLKNDFIFCMLDNRKIALDIFNGVHVLFTI